MFFLEYFFNIFYFILQDHKDIGYIFPIDNPLESFEIKITSINVFLFFQFFFSNFFFTFLLITFIIFFIVLYNYIFNFIIPKGYQILFEDFYIFIIDCLQSQAGKISERFFVFIFSIFFFILLSNLIGIVFYSYTITSQIIITFGLAISAMIFIIFIGLIKKRLNFFLLFYPSGNINIFLKIFLVFIEIISFLIRPFSLAIRLFANMLAGHTLLHILASFNFFIHKNIIIFGFISLTCIFLIGLLEVLIAFIQAYVYTILLCIYLNDSLANIEH